MDAKNKFLCEVIRPGMTGPFFRVTNQHTTGRGTHLYPKVLSGKWVRGIDGMKKHKHETHTHVSLLGRIISYVVLHLAAYPPPRPQTQSTQGLVWCEAHAHANAIPSHRIPSISMALSSMDGTHWMIPSVCPRFCLFVAVLSLAFIPHVSCFCQIMPCPVSVPATLTS